MASFLDLPAELTEQIICILAEEKPPSAKLLHEEPSHSLLRSGCHPLKDLSLTCRALRGMCFSSLFSAVKVVLDSIVSFLKFSKSYSLSTYVVSLVLSTDPKSQGNISNRIYEYCVWPAVARVINLIKPSVMTVLFPPSLFAKILPYQLNLTDQWAFSIPFQVLRLKTPRYLALSTQISQATMNSQNVFRLLPWTHCAFNQGSSIKGYSSYEYFSKRTPFIFEPSNPLEFRDSMIQGSFENMTSLAYVAIFPIDHIARFCYCMSKIRSLKRLRVQFAPTAGNDVLDDLAALGKCQPGDLWQEFESCYNTLTTAIEPDLWEGWLTVEEFVSLDYGSPSLRELIDRTAGRRLKAWEFDPNGGRWTRKGESLKESN